ncbi:WxL domain-containing protein [Lactiplantibacillus pentosus]|uniref:Extracellular protein n=1 Tax=Lactiplantibacillus pentosus IG1 TaxID=1042160 RepID=G0M5Q2_LACPE|nr:WxL domain-containing protein [Lactiplantibacillus pentosus]CCC17596.1 extracellular protein [Lactiplantibacillus pentosus IG1]MCT3304495.1 WxL domain-containing protein [Lactiplantibacillus pentosus]PRO81971.1 WxL domain-containing protein [Lactiplantibacillus pentosus]PRO83607.1 WxL domain-containing protein [Lactiplantibacillus pentosus]PRO93466.1 WxL domain-containing protein [Lactiplantibacillus pentosus]
MKKTLLGLLFSAGLVASMGLTASAADEPQISNGTVGFEGGDVTIDNGDTDLKGASLDFGTNKITNSSVDDNYNNTNKAAMISVIDLRGTAAGWKLNVKQNDVFKNAAAAANKELTGADATVNTGVALDSIGADKPVMSAETGKGNGKNAANIAASTLMVPHTTARAQGSYTTTLTWSLNATVANK